MIKVGNHVFIKCNHSCYYHDGLIMGEIYIGRVTEIDKEYDCIVVELSDNDEYKPIAIGIDDLKEGIVQMELISKKSLVYDYIFEQ